MIESPTVTDRVRALLLHRNKYRRLYKQTFNPHETMKMRAEVKDLYEASLDTGDQPLINSIALLIRQVERQHALNVLEYRDQGHLHRGGENRDGKPSPVDFFHNPGDVTLCYAFANCDEAEFEKIIKEAIKEGNNSWNYLLHRFRPLTDEEKTQVAEIEAMFDQGMTRKEIVAELGLGSTRGSRLISYVPKEKRKEARRRAVSKPAKKPSNAAKIANRSVELMEEGLALMDLVDLDRFDAPTRRTVVRNLLNVIKDIRALIGEEDIDVSGHEYEASEDR